MRIGTMSSTLRGRLRGRREVDPRRDLTLHSCQPLRPTLGKAGVGRRPQGLPPLAAALLGQSTRSRRQVAARAAPPKRPRFDPRAAAWRGSTPSTGPGGGIGWEGGEGGGRLRPGLPPPTTWCPETAWTGASARRIGGTRSGVFAMFRESLPSRAARLNRPWLLHAKRSLFEPMSRPGCSRLQALVDSGWSRTMDELVLEALRRYAESHREALMAEFIQEDIEWGLRGRD